MRAYIMEFLKSQFPSMIFSEGEKHGTNCSYIYRIWKTRGGLVKVFECYFNEISLINEGNRGDSVLLIGDGKIDNSLYSRLSRKIKTYESLEDMERPRPLDPKLLSQIFGYTGDRFLEVVLEKGRRYRSEQCEVKDFRIIDLNLGAFGCLVRIEDVIDSFVLFVNRTNQLTVFSELTITREFFENVFGSYFEFDWSIYYG